MTRKKERLGEWLESGNLIDERRDDVGDVTLLDREPKRARFAHIIGQESSTTKRSSKWLEATLICLTTSASSSSVSKRRAKRTLRRLVSVDDAYTVLQQTSEAAGERASAYLATSSNKAHF